MAGDRRANPYVANPSAISTNIGGAGTGFGNSTTLATAATGRDAAVRRGDAGPTPDQKPTCGGVEVEPMIAQQVVPGNVLIVFDESLSMNETWSGGQSKWKVATQAVIAAITSLQDQINAATLFFPNAGFDVCGVSAIDSGSQINFLAGPKFVSAWNTYMASHGPSGLTPTGTAMQLADTALKNASLTGTTAVVVITDGDPNCGTNDSQVNQLAADWLTKGIKTHVFGLPGASAGTARLNALAASGGTGQFITPNDPAALQMSLAEIAGSAVSASFDTCRITLPTQPPNLADVTLVVVQQGVKQSVARDLGAGGGWNLDANGAGITLLGALCDQAKQGAYAKISVVFGCVDLPPLPPPKPPS